jgi:probable F420-dependent oxidoreductase
VQQLGRFGIWSRELRTAERSAAADAAAELEQLGFGALWFPAGVDEEFVGVAEALLAPTSRVVVATGVVNIWTNDPARVAEGAASLSAACPGRFLLGVGIGHRRAVPDRYRRPLEALGAYLDVLDAAAPPIRRDERILASLSPRSLDVARERSLGSHPYLTTPEHTGSARERLGPEALLAPEQMLVLEEDPDRARALARAQLAAYLELPNYTRNLLRTGFEEADLAGGWSDRLVDGLVAWGSPDAIVDRAGAHLRAGADHVCLQVLGADRSRLPLAEWRALAAAVARVS